MLAAGLSRDEIWSGLRADLGDELLGQLLRVSSEPLALYASDVAPEAVEARARFLATVVNHLSGTYTPWGVRRWFGRARSQLEGTSPLQVLVGAGDWTPEGPAAESVAALARALLRMPAT